MAALVWTKLLTSSIPGGVPVGRIDSYAES
jgi:hypothetical protein